MCAYSPIFRVATGRGMTGFTSMERQAVELSAKSSRTMDDCFSGDWIVTRLVSRLSGRRGYTCEVEAVKFNDDAAVEDVEEESSTDLEAAE